MKDVKNMIGKNKITNANPNIEPIFIGGFGNTEFDLKDIDYDYKDGTGNGTGTEQVNYKYKLNNNNEVDILINNCYGLNTEGPNKTINLGTYTEWNESGLETQPNENGTNKTYCKFTADHNQWDTNKHIHKFTGNVGGKLNEMYKFEIDPDSRNQRVYKRACNPDNPNSCINYWQYKHDNATLDIGIEDCKNTNLSADKKPEWNNDWVLKERTEDNKCQYEGTLKTNGWIDASIQVDKNILPDVDVSNVLTTANSNDKFKFNSDEEQQLSVVES
jgi:hypothetical protein